MSASKTEAQKVVAAERRRFVLDMLKDGATYRQIAQAAIAEFGIERLPEGWDERCAFEDAKHEIERLMNALAAHFGNSRG